MKILAFLLGLACATLLAVLAALYASGRLNPAPPTIGEIETQILTDPRFSLFPEQSAAVQDLMTAILARQEVLERQEERLIEWEVQLRQEALVLARMREELAAAREDIYGYFRQMDAMVLDWDEDERQNSRKLAEFYARMEPQNAARLLSKIEPDRAARILTFLSDRQAGGIMDAAVALGNDGIETAVKWSEIIRQMKKPRPTTEAATP